MTLKLTKKDPILERLRNKRELLVLRGGKFVPKEAPAAEKVADNLRHLPSEIVTKDDADGTKAHELDPAHIVNSVAREFVEKVRQEELGPSAMERFRALLKPTDTYMPLTQYNIDFVKWRVQNVLLNQAVELAKTKPINPDAEFWIYFPERDLRVYELRVGSPPKKFEKKDRHLCDFNLSFKLFSPPPPAVRDALLALGIPQPDVARYVEEMKLERERRREVAAAFNREIHDRLVKANPGIA